jgi:hypothetical protein
MNVTLTEAGVIHSLLVTVFFLVMVLVASKGKNAMATVPISAFFCILLFTFMGWFPVWTGSIIALVLVIFVGYTMGKIPGVV